MSTFTRRQFLTTAALAAGSASLLPGLTGCATSRPIAAARVRGANEDIRVAVIGFNGRGASHIAEFSKLPGVRLVALCDVDSQVLGREVQQRRDRGESVEGYRDLRKLLENPNIDAVSIATPNHWHSLAGIWAIQAGKDVYVEKPVSHNVHEGRKLVEAARKYQRIVQTGTQSRSMASLRAAWAWIHEGHIGKIKIARGLCYKRRPSIGKVDGPQPIPPRIDYDLWCGPALKLPLMREHLHYDWHWVWNTGNGDIGNQGVHEMDKCRWALGTTLPTRVFSIGGRLGYVDDGETANTQMAVYDYGDALLIFEVRGLPERSGAKNMDQYRGESIGQVIECDGGYVAGTTAFDNNGKEIKKFTGPSDDHFANFIRAVRSRRVEDLNADILQGHLSSALCHLGNISYRLGRPADPDTLREQVKNDSAALETLARMEDHLAANGVDLKKTELAIGPTLRFDPEKERFVGNSQANALLTRHYRKPFVVPERV